MRRILSAIAFLFLCQQVLAASPLGLQFDPVGSQSNGTTLAPSSSPVVIPSAPASTPVPSMPETAVTPGRDGDYSANQQSDVFGAQLFSGAFARTGGALFNPDYLINVGDRVDVQMWGAFSYADTLLVDPQGNIFLPHVGPVRLLGVKNSALQQTVEAAVRRVFRANVNSYASLAAAQPVRVFVTGYVHRPGLYNGTSTDSLLHYLDQAGGIDPDRGSFLDVEIKRSGKVRAQISLYDFLLSGNLPPLQLWDGDVILVQPRKSTVLASGLASNAKRFEFRGDAIALADVMKLAKPNASATHVRVVRNQGTVRNTEYFPLEDANNVMLGNGDEVEFTADKKPGTITVRVEGEHLSPQEYVLPYGASMGELMSRVEPSPRSDMSSIQLYRISVRERQRLMLQTSLQSLESSVLTARSGTSDEARLRKDEADLILQWVDRAKKVEPRGQVTLADTSNKDLLLENGDVLRIPVKDGLVLVSGEVLFPTAIAYRKDWSAENYIEQAGGFAQNAESSRVVLAHRDGRFAQVSEDAEADVVAGDEILVLPKIDVKSRQVAKDLTQILYQIAVSAKVVLGL